MQINDVYNKLVADGVDIDPEMLNGVLIKMKVCNVPSIDPRYPEKVLPDSVRNRLEIRSGHLYTKVPEKEFEAILLSKAW